ncbi:MAG: hypothetical protein JNM56_28630, partial [Planctomycetia bacterium]|nr:hypothetical protein [Planctomycetia bacterium]
MRTPRCLAPLFLLLLGSPRAPGAAEPSVPDFKAEIVSGRVRFAQVLPWLDTDEPNLQRLLLEAALQRDDWKRDAVEWLRACQVRPEAGDERERHLTGVLQTFAGVETIQQLVTQTLTRPNVERRVRVQLLQCLGRARLDTLPEAWLSALEKLLADDDAVMHEAVYTVKARGVERCDAALRAIAQHADHPAAVRIAALECVAPRQRGWEPEAFALLRRQLSTKQPATMQAAAARTLGAGRLSAAQLSQLTADWPRLPGGIVALLLPAYSRSKDEATGLAVVAALEQLPVSTLSLGELDRALAGYP